MHNDQHCGQCNTNRQIDLPDGRVARCPRCHPLRDTTRRITCRIHPDETAETCRACLAPAAPRAARVKRALAPVTAGCPHGTKPGAVCLACRRHSKTAPAAREARRA